MNPVTNPQEQMFLFDVFISYRHAEEDRKAAKWLIESLETYRVPKSLCKHGLPERIGRVFRDEDELPTSPNLSRNIEEALLHSRFLVIVCSKKTPESQWVNREVEIFRKLGRGDFIIPLLIDGEPEDSFPRALKELKKTVFDGSGRRGRNR